MFVLDVTSKFIGPANQYDVSSSTSSSVAHKYLQVALVADENVAAKHGNHTADFLLVLANIVSSVFTVGESILSKHYCYASRHYITNSSLCFKIRTHRLSGFFCSLTEFLLTVTVSIIALSRSSNSASL